MIDCHVFPSSGAGPVTAVVTSGVAAPGVPASLANSWRKVRTRSDCCGSYGQPGCWRPAEGPREGPNAAADAGHRTCLAPIRVAGCAWSPSAWKRSAPCWTPSRAVRSWSPGVGNWPPIEH